MAVFISVPISSPRSLTGLSCALDHYRHSGLMYGPIWKRSCSLFSFVWLLLNKRLLLCMCCIHVCMVCSCITVSSHVTSTSCPHCSTSTSGDDHLPTKPKLQLVKVLEGKFTSFIFNHLLLWLTFYFLVLLDQELVSYRYSSCSSCWSDLFKQNLRLVISNQIGVKFVSWTRGFFGAQVPWSYDAGIPRKIPMSMNLDSVCKAAGRPRRKVHKAQNQ